MRLRYLVTKLIYGFFVLVELILALRFVLRLFGANASNSFVQWSYDTSAALLAPFRGIFPNAVLHSSYVLELTTIFAMIIYAIVSMLLIALVDFITRPVEHTVIKKK